MSKLVSIFGCGAVASVVSAGIAYGIASLPCPLVSKPADKVCYVRAFGNSLDTWKIGLFGGVMVGLVCGLRSSFRPIHLSSVGLMVLITGMIANKSNGSGVTNSISRTTIPNSLSSFSPRMNAFLATIRWAETGTSDKSSYSRLVFNGTFNNNFATHPRIKQCAPINRRNICSTAAGAYQMLDISWNDLQPNLGLKDFTPASQDKMAIEYIRRNKAIRDVEAGNFEMAACKVGKVWASFPCNNYKQNAKSLDKLQSFYNQQLALNGG